MLKFKYAKGRRFEYKVRDFLRSKNCYVSRSAKSSFPDLIVVTNEGVPFFVECKNQADVPFDPTKLLTKEEYQAALDMVRDFKTPFILFFNKHRKMMAICIGGKGLPILYSFGLM